MKNILINYLILLTIFCSCSSIKESIIDTRTEKTVGGYCKDCTYQIGRTMRKDFSEQDWKTAEKDNLVFVFSNDTFPVSEEDILVGIVFSGPYRTSKGIKIGDTILKASQIYGAPKARAIDFWKDPDARIHWVYYGLFYDNLSFVCSDTGYSTIIGAVIGHSSITDLKANKKYLKK